MITFEGSNNSKHTFSNGVYLGKGAARLSMGSLDALLYAMMRAQRRFGLVLITSEHSIITFSSGVYLGKGAARLSIGSLDALLYAMMRAQRRFGLLFSSLVSIV